MINLMYVSCPVRITGEKDGEKVKSYVNSVFLNSNLVEDEFANINEITSCGFSATDYERYQEQIYNKFASLGWKNINIAPCAKEEFETETGAETEFDQIGYFQVYLRADLENKGEEVAYAQYELSFGKFLTEKIFDLIRTQASLFYSGNGYTIKNIDCCTRGEYFLNNKPDDPVLYEENWDERRKK